MSLSVHSIIIRSDEAFHLILILFLSFILVKADVIPVSFTKS